MSITCFYIALNCSNFNLTCKIIIYGPQLSDMIFWVKTFVNYASKYSISILLWSFVSAAYAALYRHCTVRLSINRCVKQILCMIFQICYYGSECNNSSIRCCIHFILRECDSLLLGTLH